jgi:O-6-methylguanine DNA methyltransferase
MSPTSEIRLPITTHDGEFIARYSEKGLAGLDFPSPRSTETKSTNGAVPRQIAGWHRTTIAAIKRALEGKAPEILPPLDLSAGTAFQQRVWNALRRIQPGETCSYGEIAKRIGNPQSARAVGSACGANPIPIFVPCHRVLAAGGKIGGFSCGLEVKRRLLALEGIQLRG